MSDSAGSDPRDFTGQYNTPLSPDEEGAYQSWAQGQSQAAGRDINNDNYDYDMRGAWKAGAGAAGNGHFPDTFKKPNHPTFSDQSQYHGVDGHTGGTWGGGSGQPWTFTPGASNLRSHTPDELQQYFQRAEPGNRLLLPPAPAVGPGSSLPLARVFA